MELVETFPNSVYAPKALASAGANYFYAESLGEKDISLQRYTQLLDGYPRSKYWRRSLWHVLEIYASKKDKASAILKMQELIKKYPKGEISERAEESIKKIEKWDF